MATFNNKNNKFLKVETPPTTISTSTNIIGDMDCSGDVKINGILTGNIKTTGKVIVGQTGKVEGLVIANNVIIQGEFKGTIDCTGTLCVKYPAKIDGKFSYANIEIEHGVNLAGSFLNLNDKEAQNINRENNESALKESYRHLQIVKDVPTSNINIANNKIKRDAEENDNQGAFENLGWG